MTLRLTRPGKFIAVGSAPNLPMFLSFVMVRPPRGQFGRMFFDFL
jgi:hypothetical protein